MVEFHPDVPTPPRDSDSGIDLSLIRENLVMTPWERIMVNDDTANFVETLRAAVNKNYAKTARAAGEAR